MLAYPFGFPLQLFLLHSNVSGFIFLLLFCAVTEIRTARGGGGGRELFQGAAVICSVLIPWLGGGKVFLSALLEGHILNIEKQREEED